MYVNIYPSPVKRAAISLPVTDRRLTVSLWLPSRRASFTTGVILSVWLHPSPPYLKESWIQLRSHIGVGQRNRQCGLVYVSKYTNLVFKGKWRYETYDIAELNSQYQIYVLRKCKCFICEWAATALRSAEVCEMKSICGTTSGSIYMPWRPRPLNLSSLTTLSPPPNSPRYMCHGKNGGIEIRQYYFSSSCHVSIHCTFIKMKKEDVIYHYLKATPRQLPMLCRQSS